MTDKMTPAQRHYCMSRIHGKGTKPELKVRQWLWRHGYRYRLNVKSVPGKPDIVMRRYRTAIFVNGCFWHGHHVETRLIASLPAITNSSCCKIPQTNREFWVNKIKRNQERDQKNYQVLHDNGWACGATTQRAFPGPAPTQTVALSSRRRRGNTHGSRRASKIIYHIG